MQETRLHSLDAAVAAGAGEHHLAGTHTLHEIVGGKADAAFGQIQLLELPAHGPVEPGVGMDVGRPASLVEPGEHHAVHVEKPRLERTQDAHTRMRVERRANMWLGQESRKHIGVFREGGRRCVVGRFRERFQYVSEGFGVVRSRCGQTGVYAGENIFVRLDKVGERARAGVGEREQRLQRFADARREIGRHLPVRFAKLGARIALMEFARAQLRNGAN